MDRIRRANITSAGDCEAGVLLLGICCGLQIRPVEEQLKQRVIGKRYCISRKRKSCKGSTSRARLAVRLSNVS